ncbi:MAG: N-acetylmuramoyl-L-alanine amidase, partial [Ginsengibacter sp.]
MITLSWYLLKVIICSGILCGYYFLALRNKTFHRWNRFYILASIVLAVIVPLMKINIFKTGSDKGTVIQILQTITYGDEAVIEYSKSGYHIDSETLLESGYLIISMIFLSIFFISLFKIGRLKKRFPETKIKDISFINTNAKGTPFSFFKSIFWNNAIDLQSKQGQKIFNHELAHIKEKHSYDKIFMSVVLIFFWINPFFWLMRKELYMIHEFVADKEALEDNDLNDFAEMILQTVYPGQRFSIANSFFYSPIKRRLLMLTKNKNPKVNYASRLLVLPLAAIVFFAFTIKMKSIKASPLYDGKRITVVVDAGHGGQDGGAAEGNIREKDLTLNIAKLVKELNGNKNINIVLTRDKDEFMSVKDKVNFASSKGADLFISIHINKEEKKNLNSGIDILIPGNDNKYVNQSKLLGSSIMKAFRSNYSLPVGNDLKQQSYTSWVLRANQCPSVLIEAGFLSTQKDLVYLIKPSSQQMIARNILNGIENYAEQNTTAKNKNLIDSIPGKRTRKGFFGDTRNKVIIPADKIIFTTPAEKTKANIIRGIIIINGKIEPNSILKTKTITAGILTIHSGDEKDMIIKYGDAAKNGVFVLDDAIIKDTPPIYSTGKASSDTDKIFTKVENEASFPGGQSEWQKYIAKSIQTSLDSFTRADFGTCILKFIVNMDGTVSDVKATTMQGTQLARFAVDAIRKGPKWIPASQNGHSVASYRLQPLTLSEPNAFNKSSQELRQPASFSGGQEAWLRYVTRIFQNNGNKLLADNSNSGTCKGEFTVDKTGNVHDVQASTMKGTQLADLAVNMIKKVPRWNPGISNGYA